MSNLNQTLSLSTELTKQFHLSKVQIKNKKKIYQTFKIPSKKINKNKIETKKQSQMKYLLKCHIHLKAFQTVYQNKT
jgi:hypothetical protein